MFSRRKVKDIRLEIHDERSPWKRHVEYIEIKFWKVLNLMIAVAGYDRGLNRQTLLCTFQALIRSYLDYGCF